MVNPFEPETESLLTVLSSITILVVLNVAGRRHEALNRSCSYPLLCP